MKYAVEMGSRATKYIPSFIKIGSGIQKMIGGWLHRQHDDDISLLLFLQNKVNMLINCRSQWPRGLNFLHFTEIVSSNLTQGMDVSFRLFCVYVVLCVGIGLATGWSSVQGVLPTMYRIKKLKKAA
jgi:hypothetical protein